MCCLAKNIFRTQQSCVSLPLHKCDVETLSLECTNTESGLFSALDRFWRRKRSRCNFRNFQKLLHFFCGNTISGTNYYSKQSIFSLFLFCWWTEALINSMTMPLVVEPLVQLQHKYPHSDSPWTVNVLLTLSDSLSSRDTENLIVPSRGWLALTTSSVAERWSVSLPHVPWHLVMPHTVISPSLCFSF